MGTLIQAVADGMRVPEETVAVAARRLRAGGVLRPGKPGRGGAEVTSYEAATLMIALSSGAQLNQTPHAVKKIARLPLMKTPTGDVGDRWPQSDQPLLGPNGEVISGRLKQQVFDRIPFANWKAGRTFIEMLEKAVDYAVRGNLFPTLTEDDFERSGINPSRLEYEGFFTVQVATPAELDTGRPLATVHYGGKGRFMVRYIFGSPGGSFEFRSGMLSPRQPGLAFIGQFSVDAIEAAAAAIREQGMR
jgi:hypothetical protein